MTNNITWRKSTYSGGQNNDCVEVAEQSGHHLLRDSKAPHSGNFQLGRDGFSALIAAVKDLPRP